MIDNLQHQKKKCFLNKIFLVLKKMNYDDKKYLILFVIQN